MKWSIVGLFTLGVVSAVCAAVLVASIQTSEHVVYAPVVDAAGATGAATAESTPVVVDGVADASDLSPTSEVRLEPAEPDAKLAKVLVAAANLEPLTVVGPDAVSTKTVPSELVPKSALSDPIQVIGKVLLFPMKAGQVFAPSAFASEGSGVHLVSALSSGMRAVSVDLKDSMGIERFLYPGASVDVLASMKMRTAEGLEQPTSFTLLSGVVVLAIGTKTVVSMGAGESSTAANDQLGRPTVTLLVDTNQAERLKLAVEEGSVSLALRNPKDNAPVVADKTRLGLPQWTTTIVRGGVAETRTFALTSGDSSGRSIGSR